MKRIANPLLARMLLAALAMLLAGCPRTTPPVHADAMAAVPTRTATPAPPATPPTARKPAPRMGGPLPAQELPQPVKLDYSCSADSDCAVKDVGSCCGARPACVNAHSPAAPQAVRAACAKQGLRGSCAVGSFKHCGCRQGRCAPTDRVPVGGWPDDPPLPPDPVR